MTFPWLNLIASAICFYAAFKWNSGKWWIFWMDLIFSTANAFFVVEWLIS